MEIIRLVQYLHNIMNVHCILDERYLAWLLNLRWQSRKIPKNLILSVRRIIEPPIRSRGEKSNFFLYENIINLVLSALMEILLANNQLYTLDNSLLIRLMVLLFKEGIDKDNVLSSANRLKLKILEEFGKSFMKIKKSNGPKIEPWRTPFFYQKRARFIFSYYSTLFSVMKTWIKPFQCNTAYTIKLQFSFDNADFRRISLGR